MGSTEVWTRSSMMTCPACLSALDVSSSIWFPFRVCLHPTSSSDRTSYCSRPRQTAHYGCTHSCLVSVLSSFPFRFSQRSHHSFRVSTSYGATIRQHLTRCTLVKQRC